MALVLAVAAAWIGIGLWLMEDAPPPEGETARPRAVERSSARDRTGSTGSASDLAQTSPPDSRAPSPTAERAIASEGPVGLHFHKSRPLRIVVEANATLPDAGGARMPEDGPIEIPATVGAHVTLVLDLDTIATREEIAALEGESLTFWSRSASQDPFASDRPLRIVTGDVSAEGRIELRSVPPNRWSSVGPLGAPEIQVLAPFLVAPGFAFETKVGERLQVVVPMERGARLAGRVQGPTGESIPNASLDMLDQVDSLGASGTFRTHRATDADGRFEFEAVPAGSDMLVVRAPGYLELKVHAEEVARLLASRDLATLRLAKARTLSVRAVGPGGLPAQGLGLALEIGAEQTRELTMKLRTDAGGEAVFTEPPTGLPGSLRLQAFGRLLPEVQTEPGTRHFFREALPSRYGLELVDDARGPDLWCFEADVTAAQWTSGEVLEFEVRRAPIVRGRVLGIDPTCTDAVAVHVLRPGAAARADRYQGAPLRSLVVDAASGFFEGQLPPGRYRAAATMGGDTSTRMEFYGPSVRVTPEVELVVMTNDVELELSFGPAVAITGSVRSPEGERMPGLRLLLELRGNSLTAVKGHVLSGADGRFDFAPQPSGRYSVRVASSRHVGGLERSFTIADGEALAPLEIVAEPAGAIRVDARSIDERPRDLIALTFRRPGRGSFAARPIEDDPEWSGAYGPFAAGDYEVSLPQFLANGAVLFQRESVRVEAGSVTEVQLRDLADAPVRAMISARGLEGEHAGAPLAAVHVRLFERDRLIAQGATDEAGRCTLPARATGKMVLEWGANAWSPIDRRVVELATGDNTLAPLELHTGAIVGLVPKGMERTAAPAVFLPGAGPEDEPFRRADFVKNGRFRIAFLPDGVYELTSIRGQTRGGAESAIQVIQIENGAMVQGVQMQR